MVGGSGAQVEIRKIELLLKHFGKSFCSNIRLPFRSHWVINSGPLPKALAPFLAACLGTMRQHSAEKKHSEERQKRSF